MFTNFHHSSRGPASGYVDALEARLNETESLLRQILIFASEDLIQKALSHAFPPPIAAGSTFKPPKTSAAEKRKAVEFWAQHPLQTVEDVLRWSNIPSKVKTSYHPDPGDDPDLRKLPENTNPDAPPRHNVQRLGFDRDVGDGDRGYDPVSIEFADMASSHSNIHDTAITGSSDRHSPESESAQSGQIARDEYTNATRHSPEELQDDLYVTASYEDQSMAPNGSEICTRTSDKCNSNESSQGMGFSKEFQERFLW